MKGATRHVTEHDKLYYVSYKLFHYPFYLQNVTITTTQEGVFYVLLWR